MDKSRIGYSKVIITPPYVTPLGGYGCKRFAEGLHDNLYARVILIEAKKLYLLIQLDLLSIDEEYVDFLAHNISSKYCIKEENIFISCIHTHSGPASAVLSENLDAIDFVNCNFLHNPLLSDYFLGQIIWAVGKACKNLCGFKFSCRQSFLQGVGLNRRLPALLIDENLQVLIFDLDSGKKVIIYNYQCHPTIMNQENCVITADFPGQSAALLESQKDVACAAYYNGACGDISTRFTRRESSISEVISIGNILGGEVLKLISQQATETQLYTIKAAHDRIEIDIRKFVDLPEAQRIFEEAKANLEKATTDKLEQGEVRLVQSVFEGAALNLELIKKFEGIKKISFIIKALRLNEKTIVFIPGELFCKLGLLLKAKFPGQIIISCYSNGYMGYIPDIESYDQGGYEVLSSMFAKGDGEKVVDRIIHLVESLQ